jgi:drug/metabolite transporter (DMT)-like permease|tara:strand:+ start:1228 stop:2085 length:858 start_codon:yes stop_codon:yes gene_type:complete
MKIFILTSLALIAFAANSVLCRLALGNNVIDASSFTIIRLLAGAIVLFCIVLFSKGKTSTTSKGSLLSSFMLFLYAITFSFAYLSLDTGTGALILFGAVQITIIIHTLLSGNKLRPLEWLGVIISFLGFIYLISPGVSSPSIIGFILMTIAGISWGIYTIKGQTSKNPLRDTTYNFIKTLPFITILYIATMTQSNYSTEGILLAVIAGGVTSGIGYTIWYMAIRGLSSIQSAVLQLLVPVIAAFSGVIFISEIITVRLTVSSILILGGVLIVTLYKYSLRNNPGT